MIKLSISIPEIRIQVYFSRRKKGNIYINKLAVVWARFMLARAAVGCKEGGGGEGATLKS
jgi:hypothetical protein